MSHQDRNSEWRKNRIQHANNRAWERYGVNVSPSEIAYKIECGEGTMLNDRHDCQRWLVECEGVKFDVIYDKQMRCLRTVLPPTRPIPENIKHRYMDADRWNRQFKLERDKRDKERACGG